MHLKKTVIKNLIFLLIASVALVNLNSCAWTHYETGKNYLKKQKYGEAIESFNTALEKNPKYSKVHTSLGIAYYKNEMYEKAVSELKAAKKK